jgi:hypothetical protein
LSISRLKTTGAINALWAAMLIALGVWLVPKWGAAGAATAFLIAHVFSSLLANIVLYRHEPLPAGYLAATFLMLVSTLAFAAFAYARAARPAYAISLTLWLTAIWLMVSLLILWLGIRHGCFPRVSLRSNQARSLPSLSET